MVLSMATHALRCYVAKINFTLIIEFLPHASYYFYASLYYWMDSNAGRLFMNNINCHKPYVM